MTLQSDITSDLLTSAELKSGQKKGAKLHQVRYYSIG